MARGIGGTRCSAAGAAGAADATRQRESALRVAEDEPAEPHRNYETPTSSGVAPMVTCQMNPLMPVRARPTMGVFISQCLRRSRDGLGVGDEATDVVVKADPVAAHELAGEADGLANPKRW
ncbi:hypothetical protein [Pseudonocardia halophobica]|uniref:hypothetical protein n=1 Tax=Pseudonocardia halophobica TaxID=29401 RepID=UPI0012DC3CF2|nr:hypothetical protein [Pseudonocardia halophobica]